MDWQFSKRTYIVSFIIVVVFLLYRFLSPTFTLKPEITLSPQSTMEGIKITQKKDGVVKWHITANQALFLENNTISINTLSLTFPDRQFEVRSDSGFYNTSDKKLEIKGNIQAFTGGLKIKADKLSWDSQKNEIYTDNQIIITGSKFTLQGQGLEVSQNKAVLKNNVKAVFEGG